MSKNRVTHDHEKITEEIDQIISHASFPMGIPPLLHSQFFPISNAKKKTASGQSRKRITKLASKIVFTESLRFSFFVEESFSCSCFLFHHFGTTMGTQSSTLEENKAYEIDFNPDEYYRKAKELGFSIDQLPINDGSTPKKEGSLRVVCVSDTHGMHRNLPKIKDADILIHAGDFSNTGETDQVEDLAKWLKEIDNVKYKVIIAGNHDLTFEQGLYESKHKQRFHRFREFDVATTRSFLVGQQKDGIYYLEDEGLEIEGINFWGSPQSPWFCDWAFNVERGQDILNYWNRIPTETDILITHGPPIGHGDECKGGNRAGCTNLLRVIQQRVKPTLHVFGHIHEGYGLTTDGTTTYANASSCNISYNPNKLNPPIYFDIPRKLPQRIE